MHISPFSACVFFAFTIQMFRVFSKFNALFFRPRIKGAIQEYQTQLIERVKEDIRTLQDMFKTQYPNSEVCIVYAHRHTRSHK